MRPLTLAALCLLSPLVCADPIDDFVAKQMKAFGVPGVSVAVLKDGKVVKAAGYGYADVENQVKATADTVYQIGSVSKQFCATIVMRLVERGKVELDQTLRSYLPQLPELWKDLTIRQLLTHTSGIPNYTDIPEFEPLVAIPGSDQKLVEIVAKHPMDFKPGEKWSYSNTGYYLLGMLVEKLTSKTFQQVLESEVTGPLGMASTRMNEWPIIIPNRARGYDPAPSGPKNAQYIDMKWPGAAGAMVSSVRDLAAWLAAQGSEKLLKPASWQAMWTPVKLNDGSTNPYGFGWGLPKLNGIQLITHDGGIPGFNSSVLRVPAKRLEIVVLTNALPGHAGEIAKGIGALMDPDLKDKAVAIKDPSPELTKKLRSVFEQGLTGSLNPADFSDQMAALLFPAHQNDLRDALGAQGPIKSFELVELKDADGRRTRVYRVQVGVATVTVRFVVGADGKIAGFGIGG